MATGIILYIKYQNLYRSFFLIALFSLPIINPGKYYEQELLGISQITNILAFDSGRYVSYGINLTSIFLSICLVLVFAEYFKSKNKKGVIKHLIEKNTYLVIAAFGFLISGLGTSIVFSPFVSLSSVWTIQYSQIFLVGFLFYFFWRSHPNNSKLFYSTISVMIILQTLISIGQFIKQSTLGLPIEVYLDKQFYYGADEISSLARVVGTFYYPNGYAFIANLIICFLLPKAFKKNSLYTLAVLAGYLSIALTQSRSNWISAFAIFVVYYNVYLKNYKNILKFVNKRAFLYLTLIIVAALSFVVTPRLLISANFYNENGGWELRSKMFTEGWEAFYNSPWFGFGAGTNETVLNSYFPDGVTSVFPLPVLLAPLQMLLEFGLIGCLFFIIPAYIVLRRIFNKLAKGLSLVSDNLVFTYICANVVILVHYFFQNHYGAMEFTFLGLVLGSGLIASDIES